jgi:mannosyl-oligosaccharide glucosidase
MAYLLSHVALITGHATSCRGPIWIPVNYLAIRALHHYASLEVSPHRERAADLYTKLRANVIRTISSEYERTGYFWEQYNDVTGNGMRGHPFTGWTSLLLNIMAERY